jgi:hypothetical protein
VVSASCQSRNRYLTKLIWSFGLPAVEPSCRMEQWAS